MPEEKHIVFVMHYTSCFSLFSSLDLGVNSSTWHLPESSHVPGKICPVWTGPPSGLGTHFPPESLHGRRHFTRRARYQTGSLDSTGKADLSGRI